MRLGSVQAYWRTTRAEIAADTPIYALIAFYAVAIAVVVGVDLRLVGLSIMAWLIKNWLILPVVLLLGVVVRITLERDTRRGLAFRIAFGPHRMGRFFAGLVLLLTTAVFHAMFTTAKLGLSQLKFGFPNDVLQAEIDEVLHFGTDPFHFLYAAGKSDIVLKFVETAYNELWFLVIFGVLFIVAVSPAARAVRVRYVTSYLLTWILVGTVFAALFRSAGPIFYELATGDGLRFAEVTAFIAQTSGDSASTADRVGYLIGLRDAGLGSIGGGISAFPSVHVGISALNAMFAFEASRRLGWLATSFAAFVLAGSVYLGWHYAIDGYAAIIIAGAIYYGMRRAMAVRWKLGSARLQPEGETAA